jgi:AcrR family transcriptional regulator
MSGYHHGDLRRALLTAAVTAIEKSGPAALSLRDLARRAGVSHAAPTHHFHDKAGLLTVLAADGFDRLADQLTAARTGSFLDLGVAYVRFAVANRAHFAVMFRPDLYHAGDPEVIAARERAGRALYDGAADRAGVDPEQAREEGLAGWSIAHGFATLWLNGALPDQGDDPDAAARAILRHLRPDGP